MKVALVTTFFGAHRFGGDAAYVERLAVALLRRGHAVTVFYSRDAFEAVRGSQGPIPYTPPPGLRLQALAASLPRLDLLWMHQTGRLGRVGRELVRHLHEGDFDVIHFHNISLVGGTGLLQASPRQAVRLMTAHEHWLTCPLSVLWRLGRESCESATCILCTLHARRPPQFWRRSNAIQRGLSALSALIFPSRHALDAHVRRGVQHPRARVLPYFIPDEWASDTPPPPAPSDAPFRFVGRLVAEKGLQTVLPLFQSRPGARLEITGDGPFRQELQRLAAGSPNIRFLGPSPADSIRTLLPNTRALIVPSLFPETFGYVLLEAWSRGIPTLASTAGALPEVSSAGQGSICSTPSGFGQWIDQFQTRPELAREHGLIAWERSRRHFSESSHLESWESIVRGSDVVGPRLPAIASHP